MIPSILGVLEGEAAMAGRNGNRGRAPPAEDAEMIDTVIEEGK